MTGFFFVTRIAIAWLLAFLLLVIVWNVIGFDGPGGAFMLAAFIVIGFMVTSAMTHVGRVRLIADDVDSRTLGSRQRRQIEMPLEAGEAFDILEAALRELPGVEDVQAARDSLQMNAKILKPDPYRGQKPWRFNALPWFERDRNQILATVVPGHDSGRVNLVCEPERAAWTDWFRVDDGTNYENAEALSRAITRRIAERRRGEQDAARQTVTEKELTVAKLSLLHAQVEPHFLYNTLASAQLLTRSDPSRADDMLGHLIGYLRHSLPRTGNALSTLGEEVERARAYLEILVIRMGPRLALKIEVPDALNAVAMPPMMLQTLVENAIKHGLEPKPEGGTVWIIARSEGDRVAVTVADDGLGFNVERSGTGIGLKNVRERLRLAYGGAASFDIVSNFPAGVAATLRVPGRATTVVGMSTGTLSAGSTSTGSTPNG